MSYNEKLQLATTDLVLTVKDLVKPWVAVSTALAAIATEFVKDLGQGDDSSILKVLLDKDGEGKALADFADKITKLLQANNVDRAIRLCQGVAKEFKGE